MSNADKTIPYRVTDKSEIRGHLNSDREWSLYALADLDDGMFEHCDWWALADGLALVFRAIAIHPIFVLGDAAMSRTLLAALPETTGYLNCRRRRAKGPKWRPTLSPIFPSCRSSQNGPRRQGFAAPRPTTARP
jgi:hypothetical protein